MLSLNILKIPHVLLISSGDRKTQHRGSPESLKNCLSGHQVIAKNNAASFCESTIKISRKFPKNPMFVRFEARESMEKTS